MIDYIIIITETAKGVLQMILKERTVEQYTERSGGKGTMQIERLLSAQQLGEHVKMFAKVTIDLNSSIGIHPHHEDGECYYILQGTAKYSDHGKESILHAGDCTFTPAGESHGIENIGDEPLILMALIINA